MVVYSSSYAEEKHPIPTDALLLTPVADTVLSPETTFLPVGDLFKPLLADPKEPRFYLSHLLFRISSEKVHEAIGGYGKIIGLYRHIDSGGGTAGRRTLEAEFMLNSIFMRLLSILSTPTTRSVFPSASGRGGHRTGSPFTTRARTWAMSICSTTMFSESSCPMRRSKGSVLMSGQRGACIAAESISYTRDQPI